MDGHKFWEIVKSKCTALSDVAPDGYVPVVAVYLEGRVDPVPIDFVETSRGEDDPWTWFQASSASGATPDTDKPSPGDYFVLVHESHILRVELRLLPADGTLRRPFGYGVFDDPVDSAE